MDRTAAELSADTARRFDRDRYLTTLFAPRAKRPALWALYAFNVELSRARDQREEIARAIRLQWWRDAVEAIYAGGTPEAPVARALGEAVREHALSRAPIDAMIDARDDATADEAGGAISLAHLALEVLGATDTVSLEAGRLVAIAYATGEARHLTAARKLRPAKHALPALLLRRGGWVGLPLRLAWAALRGRF